VICTMARKEVPIKIKEVIFTYTGTDNDFNVFLKAIIGEYLLAESEELREKILVCVNYDAESAKKQIRFTKIQATLN